MNVTKLLLLGATALALIPEAMADPNTGWYLGAEGGVNRLNDTSADFNFQGNPSHPAHLSFNDGWVGLGTAGYAFPGHWRVEGELGYRHNNVDSITAFGNTVSTRGELNTASAMGNLLYDIPITPSFKASLGVGAGAVHRSFNDKFLIKDSDTKFAYQGIAGLSYAIAPGTDVTMNYRYLRAAGADFHDNNAYLRTDNMDNQALTIGLRFDLHPDHVRETAAAPMMEPAPQPAMAQAPPPAPRQFLVFFGFNKSNLTAEADGVVSNAAATAKQYGSASLVVVGHADTVGSDNYNQKLSERRSSAVRAALVAQGIDASKISASGRGETSLLVQTADNVKEPQNRRASIDLQ